MYGEFDISQFELPEHQGTEKNCIIYIRVSDPKQVRDGISLENQEIQCTEEAKKRGFNILNIYKDEGLSGRTEYRDAYMEMCDFIHENPDKINAVIIYHINRLGRSVKQLIDFIDTLSYWDIEFISVKDNIDNESAFGKFFFQLMASLSEMESNMISERVVPAMELKAQQGYRNGGRFTPYGFKNKTVKQEPNGRRRSLLEVVEEEAEQVRLIYDLYLNGTEDDETLGAFKIAGWLDKNGYKYRDGTDWNSRRVGLVLKNNLEYYIGNMTYNKTTTQEKKIYNPKTRKYEVVISTIGKNKGKPVMETIPHKNPIKSKGQHDAIITKETYHRVLEKRKTIKPASTKNKGRVPQYLLSGIVRCPDCDSKMIVSSHKNRKGVYEPFYQCRISNSISGKCKPNSLKEEYVLEDAKNVFLPFFEMYIFSQIPIIVGSQLKHNTNFQNNLQREKNRLEAEMKEIIDDMKTDYNNAKRGWIEDWFYLQIVNDNKAKLNELQQKIKELDVELAQDNIDSKKANMLIEDIAKYQNIREYFESLELQTQIDYIRKMINRIDFKKDKDGRGKKSIQEIVYSVNFDLLKSKEDIEALVNDETLLRRTEQVIQLMDSENTIKQWYYNILEKIIKVLFTEKISAYYPEYDTYSEPEVRSWILAYLPIKLLDYQLSEQVREKMIELTLEYEAVLDSDMIQATNMVLDSIHDPQEKDFMKRVFDFLAYND